MPSLRWASLPFYCLALIGAAAAYAANVVGKRADRSRSPPARAIALGLLLTSWIALYFATHANAVDDGHTGTGHGGTKRTVQQPSLN